VRLAFYGRFSSDNQRETSIADQLRIVQRWAHQHGHKIISEFSDEATSGASLKLLLGLQRALEAAAAEPRPFNAIVVDQLSRLSRDIGDTDAIIKRLRFIGISVIAVADNINTADETTKISVTVKSLVNELYLDDLRKATKRGLDGQFLKGYATGGRTYGFISEPVHGPGASEAGGSHGRSEPVGYRIKINPAEARVVRRIFQDFREGNGEKAIAKNLNAEKNERLWRPNTVFLMLQNQKYIGHFIFNRREWVKNPSTGRRAYRWRPPEEWEVRQSEDLRIIDDDLWAAVQHRLRTRKRLFANGRSRTALLLSGLLFCEMCGGCLSVVGNNHYGCRSHAESGICPNPIRIHRISLEQMVLSELASHLVCFVDDLVKAATQIVQHNADGDTHRHLKKMRGQADAVMDAVKSGALGGRALEEALLSYQQIWDQVQSLERQARSDSPSLFNEVRYDRSVVEDFISRLPETLCAQIDLGREFLQQTLEQIKIADVGEREISCPICKKALKKLTPQHLGKHGLGLEESYRKFPQLGFNRCTRVIIKPSGGGMLHSAKVFCLMVAGQGLEPLIPS
jgi:site-specific DNA recombinase